MRVHHCPHEFAKLAQSVLPLHYERLQDAIGKPHRAQLFVGHSTAAKTLLRGLKSKRRRDFAGCYVFLRGRKMKALYVGISRKTIARLCQHLNGKTHNDTSLVFQMAEGVVGRAKTRALTMGKKGFKGAFRKKQELLRRCHVAFIPIRNPLELYLFEAYAAMKLGTGRWNTFATH